MPDNYPEHDKLRAVKDQSQTIADFLDWLDGQGFRLAHYNRPDDHWMTPVIESRLNMFSRYFGISQTKLEKEKCSMLEEQRKLNGGPHA